MIVLSHVRLCNLIDCCLPGSSVHGISRARILEWVATSFSSESSWPRDWTCVSHISCTGTVTMDSDINLGVLTCLSWQGTCPHTCQSLCQCACIHLFLFFDTSIMHCISTLLYQFSSVTQLCLTLCHPMNRSTPGLPVHHQLPEFTQTHVHWVSDAIQPSYPLSSPSPPDPNPSQHQGLFQCVNSLHQVAKVLEFQSQH